MLVLLATQSRQVPLGVNALETILEDGKILRDMTLQEVRDIAVKDDSYNEPA
jgi:hypothetical protein